MRSDDTYLIGEQQREIFNLRNQLALLTRAFETAQAELEKVKKDLSDAQSHIQSLESIQREKEKPGKVKEVG